MFNFFGVLKVYKIKMFTHKLSPNANKRPIYTQMRLLWINFFTAGCFRIDFPFPHTIMAWGSRIFRKYFFLFLPFPTSLLLPGKISVQPAVSGKQVDATYCKKNPQTQTPIPLPLSLLVWCVSICVGAFCVFFYQTFPVAWNFTKARIFLNNVFLFAA